MIPTLGLLLTIALALLFAAVGFFLARLRMAPDAGSGAGPDLSGEVARLKQELLAAKSKSAVAPEMAGELDSLRSRVQAGDKREKGLVSQLKDLEKQRDASAAKIQQLEATIDSLKEEQRSLADEHKSLKDMQPMLEKELASLRTTLSERDEEPTLVTTRRDEQGDTAALQVELAKSNALVATGQQKVEEKQRQIETLKKQLDAAKTAARAAASRASDQAKASARTMGPAAGMTAPGAELLAAQKAAIEAKKAALEAQKERDLAFERAKTAESQIGGLSERLGQTSKLAETQRQQLEEFRQLADEEEWDKKPPTKAGVSDPERLYRNAQGELKAVRAELEHSRSMILGLKNEISDLREEEPTKIRRKADVEDEEKQTLSSKLESAHTALKARETELSKVRSQLADLEGQLEDQSSLKTMAEDSEAKLAAADGKLSQLDRLEQQVYELKDHNKQLQQKLKEGGALETLEQDHESLKMEKAVLERKAEESSQLRERHAELNEQLRSAQQDRDQLQLQLDEMRQSQDDRTDLALKVSVLQEQLREFERVRDENLKLKSKGEELLSLRGELEGLRAEYDTLRSLKLTQSAPPQLAKLPVDGGEQGMGNVLQRVVNSLAKEQGAQCAVLADEQGLVVAGFGEYIDAMAAMSALFTEVRGRVRGFLPLGALRQLALVDENALAFVAQPMRAENSDLMLAMLAPGGAPEPRAVNALVASVSERVSTD